MKGSGKGIWIAAGALTLLAALTGCVVHLGGYSSDGGSRADYRETKSLAVPHVPGSVLEVESRFGSVEIRRTSREDVWIEGTVACTSRKRAEATRLVAHRGSDRSLRIGVDWSGGRREDGEGCSFRIEVPGANGVRVKTSHGKVVVEGLRGLAVLSTSFGSIDATDQEGEVRANTSHGSITVIRAGGPVDVDTSFGSVDVSLSDANPGPVRIETSHGAVRLRPGLAFGGELSLETSHGSIDMKGTETAPHPVELRSLKDSKAKVVIGLSGKKSRIKTSFGGIAVDFRGGG